MKLDAVTLRQLRAVAAVADHGSLAAAGVALGLTTPAIYAQIRGLEAILDVQLVRRASDQSGSVLTASGRVMLDAARRMEIILSQSAAGVEAISRGLTGRVTLGVVSTGKYFAPWLVRRLQLECPGIKVDLRIGNREKIIADLAMGAVDLAIMGRPPRDPEVVADLLGPHPHGLLVEPWHKLADGRPVTADDLFKEMFLTREDGSGTRILMNRYLDGLGDGRVYDLIEMDSNETIKQAAMAGLGIAFLSLHTVTEELNAQRLVLVNAPGLPISRHWFLVRLAHETPTPAANRIRDCVIGFEGTFLPEVRQAV